MVKSICLQLISSIENATATAANKFKKQSAVAAANISCIGGLQGELGERNNMTVHYN